MIHNIEVARMKSKDELERARTLGAIWTRDRQNGISSAVGRTVYDGRRAVLVGSDASAKTQVAALMDLLALHLAKADTPSPVSPYHVTMLFGGPANEAKGAL